MPADVHELAISVANRASLARLSNEFALLSCHYATQTCCESVTTSATRLRAFLSGSQPQTMPSVDLSSCRLAPVVHVLARYSLGHLGFAKQQAAQIHAGAPLPLQEYR